jgi:competence protein ComEC
MDAVGLIAPVPRHPPADSFDGYLHGLGVAFFLSRGRLLSVQKAPTAYRRWCETIAQRMNELLGYGLGRRPALAAVYRAMMLGRRRGLSKEQGLLFMHLFAINGLHIGVVALSMNALLALLRFPRRFAAVLVLAVLWLDVDTTGASPSALRAFLMVAAVEIAWMLRRPVNPLAAVTTSALIVVLADPMEFLSASFQMSYSVVAAIFLLGLPLGARLQARFPANRDLPEGSWLWRHRAAAAATRHLYPAVGVGAAAIVAGFGSLVAGMACAAAASRLFNCAAGVLLGLIDVLLRLATEIPGAWFPAHYRATWTGPAALAALVGSCMAGYASGWRIERGGFWPPFAIAAIALGLGARFG